MSITALRDAPGAKARGWRVRWRYEGRRDGTAFSLTTVKESDAKAIHLVLENRRFAMTRQEANQWLAERAGAAPVVTTSGEAPTFATVAKDYLDSKLKMKPATRYGKECIIRVQLADWADKPIDTVTDREVVTMMQAAAGRLKNVQEVWRTARSVMRFAHKKGLVSVDPFIGMEAPDAPASPAHYMTLDETDRLIACASQERLRLIIRLALNSGLRQSEICNLRVADLTLPAEGKAMVQVRGGITRGKHTRWEEGTGKTLKSQRRVPIPRHLADDLLAHAKAHRGMYLFQSEAGRFTTPAIVYRMWTRLLAIEAKDAAKRGVAPLPHVRFHDLRHTYASRLIAAGVPMMEVSRLMGHANVLITDRAYGHLDPGSADRALSALEAYDAPKRHLVAV